MVEFSVRSGAAPFDEVTIFGTLAIMGQVTGKSYLFAGQDSALAVDERDVADLLATGRFAQTSR